MGFRFRKSFKLAPGVRMNLSGSGVGWTLGPRGASIGIGKRGTYLNAGLPGTGISSRQRLDTPAPRTRPNKQSMMQTYSICVGVSDDGTLIFQDEGGNELSDQLIRAAKKQKGDLIKELIHKKCEEINREIDSLAEIHLHTPSLQAKPVYERSEFDVPKPPDPVLNKAGLLHLLFKGRRAKLESQNRDKRERYQVELDQWVAQRAKFESKEARRKLLIEDLIYRDPDAMNEFLESSLQEIVWPRETIVSAEIFDDGRQIYIDVDLPEIDEMPGKKAAVPSSGYKLSVKELSAISIQKLYMQHVHAIAFRLIGETLFALPKAEEVVLSGYSQRPSKVTGQIEDEYLLSVRVNRHHWSGLAFENLNSIDIIESLASFELRRSMSKTGVFKPITPFAPGD